MNTIFPPVMTTDAVRTSIRRLQLAIQSLHRTNESLSQHLATTLTATETAWVTHQQQNKSDPNNVKHTIELLLDELRNRSTVTLFLAFAPSQNFVTELLDWLQEHHLTQCQVAIIVEPRIVGGMHIDWRGRHHDYSLATSLETYGSFPTLS